MSGTGKRYDGGQSNAKIDPTGTTLIRRRYAQRLRGRWDALKGAIWDAVAERDVFGLRGDDDQQRYALSRDYEDFKLYVEPDSLTGIAATAVAGMVAEFMSWYYKQIKKGVLSVIKRFRNPYIRAAYENGAQSVADAYAEQTGMEPVDIEIEPLDISPTGPGPKPEPEPDEDESPEYVPEPDEPIISATADHVSLTSVDGVEHSVNKQALITLFERNYTNLKDITDDTGQAIREELMKGLIRGENPRKVARRMNDRIDAIGKTRSTVLARTEVIHANTEATLNTFEQYGGEHFTLNSEWLATDDERTCPICHSLDGRVFSVDFMRSATFIYEPGPDEPDSLAGTYPVRPPVHPQCRCALLPLVPKQWQIPAAAVNRLPGEGPTPNIQRKGVAA